VAQPASHPAILGESLQRSDPCALGTCHSSRLQSRERLAHARATWLYRSGANSGRDRIVPGTCCLASPDACLSEQNRQQARAQEHEAGRRQNKKSVGDNVVVAHDTPTTSDARPNLLKSSEFPDRNYRAVSLSKVSLPESPGGLPKPPAVQNSSSGTIAFKCMGKKNACAHQAHQCCNCLDHRTNPLRPCHPQNDCSVAQSKRFTGWNRRSVVSDDLVQQIV
jgi:hypothetical protein